MITSLKDAIDKLECSELEAINSILPLKEIDKSTFLFRGYSKDIAKKILYSLSKEDFEKVAITLLPEIKPASITIECNLYHKEVENYFRFLPKIKTILQALIEHKTHPENYKKLDSWFKILEENLNKDLAIICLWSRKPYIYNQTETYLPSNLFVENHPKEVDDFWSVKNWCPEENKDISRICVSKGRFTELTELAEKIIKLANNYLPKNNSNKDKYPIENLRRFKKEGCRQIRGHFEHSYISLEGILYTETPALDKSNKIIYDVGYF